MSPTIGRLLNYELKEEEKVSCEPSPELFDSNVLIGIEHEFERWDRQYADLTPPQYFRESDGSLRNSGMEYILERPLKGAPLVQAILDMDAMYRKTELEINERTSTHVHIDVRDLTVQQYHNLILSYIVLEEVLFGLCTEERIGNPYCVALSQSLVMKRTFSYLREGMLNGDMFSESLRYGAISMNATQRMGSLEFRMRETIPKREDLIPWINILLGMRDFAVNKCSLDYLGFLNKLHSKPTDVILKYMLGANNAKYLQDNVPDLEERLLTGATAIYSYIGN